MAHRWNIAHFCPALLTHNKNRSYRRQKHKNTKGDKYEKKNNIDFTGINNAAYDSLRR